MKKVLLVVLLSVFVCSQPSGTFAAFGKKTDEKAVSANPNKVNNSEESVKGAMEEFKSLSRKEKKERFKLAKKEIKDYKAATRSGAAEPDTNTLLLAILAILLPPLAVYLHQGEINSKFWLSLILTLIFWLPGVIYALLVIFGNA